jgi:hypothetical protein
VRASCIVHKTGNLPLGLILLIWVLNCGASHLNAVASNAG